MCRGLHWQRVLAYCFTLIDDGKYYVLGRHVVRHDEGAGCHSWAVVLEDTVYQIV